MKRAKALGQFFTPEPVVELCYRMLRVLDPNTSNPFVIDPACGDGAFLKYASDNGIANPDRLFGIEKDAEVAAAWEKVGLSSCANLCVGDGLLPFDDRLEAWRHGGAGVHPPCSRIPILPHAHFDWVVGNPPYGTGSLRSAEKHEALIRVVSEEYIIWRRGGREEVNLATFPIELLFLERFLQLARSGGYVAIIIPDGILANARLACAREWLSERAEVRAVVSLPQHTFHRTGAAAKAGILIFQKLSEADRGGAEGTGNLPIFMAALESRKPVRSGIRKLVDTFADFVNKGDRHPSRSELGEGLGARAWSKITPCPPWAVFTARRSSLSERLDPAYHHPKYTENLRMLRSLPEIVSFGEMIEYTTYGQVGARELAKAGVRLLTPANLSTIADGFVTGVDLRFPERFVSPGSWNDPPRSRLRKGDILLANSGVGCIGRPAVFYGDEACNISQHINLIRVRGVEPEYLAVYLQTPFARLQIEREKCGVGSCGINFSRIKSILIPLLSEADRLDIAQRYRRVSECRNMDEAGRLIRKLVGRLDALVTARLCSASIKELSR